jgi:hypothetical protein
MEKIKINPSFAKSGMDKDTHPSFLDESKYTHALNANVEDESGSFISLSTEHSNILASKFKAGFRVIHAQNDINSNNTYFFLVNPSTGVGEFGVINNNQQTPNLEDSPNDCNDCYDLSAPLESLVQTNLQTYQTLLSDACLEDKTLGFNFDVRNPIKFSVIKNEKLGKTIYFTQKGNPPRYINIDKIQDYFIQTVICDDDIVLDCPDFSKLLIQKRYKIPQIEATSIELGGNLQKGTYEFLVALCDVAGTQITEYYSITQPVHIFDKNDLIIEQPNLFDETNFAIKLEVSNLDMQFTHYKVAVIQKTSSERYFHVGVYPISNTSILFTTTDRLVPTSVQEIARPFVFIEEAEGVVAANNHLYQFGLKTKPDINLQPIVNLMGEFLMWQTSVAQEGLYENGVLASKTTGYNRDEVVPFGIRFLLEGGVVTNNFPFIARQATEEDLEIVDTTDADSVNNNTTACIDAERNKRWQIYNTATVEEGFCDTDIDTIEVEETVVRTCEVKDIAESTSGSISINLTESFTSIVDYINDNKENCSDVLPTDICTILNADYSENICEDLFSDLTCATQTLVGGTENISAVSVVNEVITRVPKVFPTEYVKILPPTNCSVYRIGNDGEYTTDAEYAPLDVKVRVGNFINEDCDYAEEIATVTSPTSPSLSGGFFNYDKDTVLTNLFSPKDAQATFTNYNAKVHKKALWYRLPITEESFIVDITKQTDSEGSDDFDNYTQNIRFNLFPSCTSTAAIYSVLIDMSVGAQIRLVRSGADLIITKDGTAAVTITGGWNSTQYLIALDSKIIEIAPDFIIMPTKGCFGISKRPLEDKRVDVTWDSISFNKTASYSATCTFNQPVVGACEAKPFKKGKFAFWQSTEKYPDNNELFNSSNLEISADDFSTEEITTLFENAFTQSVDGQGNYVWKEDDLKEVTDFTCREIRHFKMPDNKIAPAINSTATASFGDSLIYPLGVTINEQVIVDFLNIAVKNNLITQQDRNKIKGYEIVRGDTRTSRSIIATGLLYDMREYFDSEAQRKIHYSNYPFNSYRDDIFNLDSSGAPITHEGWGDQNNLFTFHSPETDFRNPTLPTELSVQGYMQGTAKINFDEVKEHSKWVMLSGKAKDMAGVFAGLELLAEITIQAAQAASNAQVWALVGVSSGANLGIPAFAASGAILLLETTTAAVFKWAQYRYEWLTIFRNLGTPHNFAYYQFGEGKYNYLNLAQEEDNLVRGINSAKYLKEGMYTNTNPVTAQRVQINNLQRERSVFLDLGEYPLEHPTSYKNFDRESLTFLGENNFKQTGRSSDIFKKVGSPYVALKNYLPAQYGTINSIVWLSTGYTGDLTNPTSDCISVFGGDTFITRHFVKRKQAQFLETAFGLADKTPFNYYQYNNIGKNPKFYVSYNLNKDVTRGSSLLPDIDDEFNMDNFESSNNYRIPPSKFYLYHYGISSFLCESRINTDLRYAKTNPEQQFFPQFGDLGDYTQESLIPIKQHERFYYNNVYSRNNFIFRSSSLPIDFSKEVSEKTSIKDNGILPSLPDNSENSRIDPWLIYRPLDLFEFPTSYGKLKSVSQLENEALLTRFEHTNVIYNKVDYTNDDGRNTENPFLGGSAIFQRRSASFVNAEIGFGGTQNYTSLSCEAGHFHVDAKRGQVIQVMQGGQQSEEISSIIQGKPSGMRNWFKQHLPFKILKYFPTVDIDNNYNGVGLSMAWDSRYKRVLITKKDYIPKSDCLIYENGEFFLDCGGGNCETDNLVVNGNFDENVEGWTTFLENWIWDNGVARYIGADEAIPFYQDILTVGEEHTVSFDLDMLVDLPCENAFMRVFLGDTQIDIPMASGTSSHQFTAVCTGTVRFAFQASLPCSNPEFPQEYVTVDNVCVTRNTRTKVDLTNSNHFKEVSWTIAYYPFLGVWGSFYSFKPNYYIGHQNYFQTGINSGGSDLGLWSHLLTNKSFLVFYGNKYNFQVEYPVKAENVTKKLNNIELWTEAKRFHNEYDFAFTPLLTFNKAMIHNNVVCSGNLNLVPQKNNLAYNKNYPKTNTDGTQDILITNKDNFKWGFDYFFNRVKNNNSNTPFINFDENQIEKNVNNSAIAFSGKRVLERLEGDWFLVRMKYDKDSRYQLRFNFALNEVNI